MAPQPRELQPSAVPIPSGPHPLTAQQRRVLEYDAAGYNDKQIAQFLGLSTKAVDSLRYRANQTLDARGQDAIEEALRQGQLDENFIAENQLPPRNPLTGNQQEVLEYIAAGFTIGETANRTGLGYTGVYSRVEHAARILEVPDKGQYATLPDAVAAAAMQRGHLSLDKVAERAAEWNSAPPANTRPAVADSVPPTEKQRVALEHVAAGFNVRETAQRLGKPTNTVNKSLLS
ncbi:helix-turn-helix transcriptional regulator, partial [Nocardia gipuzkoensis]